MKFTYSWLLDHMETPHSFEVILENLTSLGFEVESFEDLSKVYEGLVVARVESCERHPNADTLSVCSVFDGHAIYQVVCGADNVREGLLGIFAHLGSKIPESGLVLKKTTLRGVESQGMLCSMRELGLDLNKLPRESLDFFKHVSSDSIIELSSDVLNAFSFGDSLSSLIQVSDKVIDLSITPNRSDALSVRGIARDLCAKGLGRLRPLHFFEPLKKVNAQKISVQLQTPSCPFFCALYVEDLAPFQTPDFIRKRLDAIGQKTIHGLVDIANYLCHDIGYPIHIYDADHVGHDFFVRSSLPGESVLCLDAKEYILSADTLVVTDGKKILSIAGIMGGMEGSATHSTRSIVIEVGYFDQEAIMKAAQHLGIQSEAKMRFERGVSIEDAKYQAYAALDLILSHGRGTFVSETCVGGDVLPASSITFSFDSLERILGKTNLNFEMAVSYLKNLGCRFESQSYHFLTVIPPSFRHDLKREEDLVEEIIRLHGYEAISESAMPPIHVRQSDVNDAKIRGHLTFLGFNEVYTWSCVSREKSDFFGKGIELLKSRSVDFKVLRPSLLCGLLDTVAANQKRSLFENKLFEVAHIFSDSQETHHGSLKESRCLAALISCIKKNYLSWQGGEGAPSFFSIKRDLCAILELMGVTKFQIDTLAPSYYHPGQKARLFQGKKTLAYVGTIHPDCLEAFDIEGPLFSFELFLDEISPIKRKIKHLSLSPYPRVERDFSFVVRKSIPAQEILNTIQKVVPHLIQDLYVFDVYEGKGLNEDQKALAFKVILQASSKTLLEEEIKDIHEKIINCVKSTYSAVLRIDC